jgi:hypothetical protein
MSKYVTPLVIESKRAARRLVPTRRILGDLDKYVLVSRINKPMPCLDPQTPQQGILTNKTARIQAFVEVNLLEV